MGATNVKREPVWRRRTVLAGATAAAALLIALVVALVQSRDDAPATAENARPVETATRFLEAYGAFDLEQMRAYLADDATIASMGAQDDPRLLVSFLEATGYRQTLRPCEQLAGSATGSVRCPFAFHALRSGEIGRGPFGGGSFDLVVRDGKVVEVSQGWAIDKFSPQVWEPFARWVSKAHPKDAAVMYVDADHTGVRLSEKSIRLWKRNTQSYVGEVTRSD
jgi:hypothetical protein